MPANPRIEDYALIGDCLAAALVGRNGSIDWLCLPRFDSGACFAALLGGPEHGRWLITPVEPAVRVERRYLDGSLILATMFQTAEGAVELVACMRPRRRLPQLVRLVRWLRGLFAMCTELILRFDYGAVVPWVERLPNGGGVSAIAGPERIVLRTPAPLRGEDLKTVGEFTVAAGETLPFVLSYSPSHQPLPPAVNPQRALQDTETFWRRWSDRCASAGPWTDVVRRSLVVLKGLTYAPTGGIVAAPTTSLPEQLGGVRNWDYRYCWLRDTTFTLLALMNAGYYDEARRWRDWLFRAVAGSPDQLQIMYGLGGERRLSEWEIPWLPGYEGSCPVRIGNAAVNQIQLDVYGSKALDASLLLLPLVGFLPPTDPRIIGTVAAIERRLVSDGFVCRYDTGEVADGLPPGEGAFLACSFWLADNLILQGRVGEARELFERLLALCNDVGLLAEEYDPRLGRQLGNFPQAFSHVALVNTAFNLTRTQGPAEQRAARR